MTTKPTRCCVLTQRGTRCANEPSPVRSTRMIGPVEIAACGLDGHQRAMRGLPDFVRHDAYCGAVGCDRPSNAGICPKHRDQYRDFGITEHALLAKEATMPASETSPEVSHVAVAPKPPTEPKDSAGVGATPSPEAVADFLLTPKRAAEVTEADFKPPATVEEFLRDLESGDGTIQRLTGDAWEPVRLSTIRKGDRLRHFTPSGTVLREVIATSDAFIQPSGAFAGEWVHDGVLVTPEPTEPVDAVEPSVGDVADAQPTDPMQQRREAVVARLLALGAEEKPGRHPTARVFALKYEAYIVPDVSYSAKDMEAAMQSVERACDRLESFMAGWWSQKHTALPMTTPTLPPEPTDLAALTARGQEPTAPGPTVAELQAELKEATRLSECRRKEVQRRGDALARMEAALKKAEDERDTLRGQIREFWEAMMQQDFDSSETEEWHLLSDAQHQWEEERKDARSALLESRDDAATIAAVTAERDRLRGELKAALDRAVSAEAEIAAINSLVDPEDAPAFDAEDQPIPLPRRVEIALMPDPNDRSEFERRITKALDRYDAPKGFGSFGQASPYGRVLLTARENSQLKADKAALQGIIDAAEWTVHHCGSYGATNTLADRVLRLLPVERQRAILELKRSEAYIEVARINARFLNPPPPGRLEEYEAAVTTLDARIAALDAEKVRE